MKVNKHTFAKFFSRNFRLFLLKIIGRVPVINGNLPIKVGYLIKYGKWVKNNSVPVVKDVHQNIFIEENLNYPINYLEFGVLHGKSIKWWVFNNQNSDSVFIGFDTFEGLPEQYGRFREGEMNPDGKIPQVNDKRCEFVKGLFQDTLPELWKNRNLTKNKRNVIHVDCDLYSGALFILTYLAPWLKKDDIIIFDDFGSISCPDHGFRSFEDFFHSYNITYKAIAISHMYSVLAVKLN